MLPHLHLAVADRRSAAVFAGGHHRAGFGAPLVLINAFEQIALGNDDADVARVFRFGGLFTVRGSFLDLYAA